MKTGIRVYFLIISFFLVFVALTTSCVNDHLSDLAKKGNPESDTTSTTTNTNTPATNPSLYPTSPNPPATTTPGAGTVSFAIDIKPILIKYQCSSCHGSYYSSYSGASSLANSGQLYGTMSWSSGFRRMPPGQKATSTELTLIANWIKQGAINN